jgi:hypothetical protein
MRWNNLRLTETGEGAPQPPLFARGAVTRTFDTPEFRGITFYEIQARSIINRVPRAGRVPFEWTINPYRGCSHSCVYCFARKSMGDTRKKPAATSGKAKKDAIKAKRLARQAKEHRTEPRLGEPEQPA